MSPNTREEQELTLKKIELWESIAQGKVGKSQSADCSDISSKKKAELLEATLQTWVAKKERSQNFKTIWAKHTSSCVSHSFL